MKLSDVLALLDGAFAPSTAEEWDRVGLACGDPDDEVTRVLFAMDPVAATAREALEAGAQLLVTHHPLFLRGTSSVAATSAKGRLVHSLVRGGCALYTAHTNADKAPHGTNDVLATLLGLRDVRALVPEPVGPNGQLDTLVTHVPRGSTQRVLDALAAAGAGSLGDYERAAFVSPGTGTFRPLDGARPAVGEVGRTEEVAEDRLEIVVPRGRRAVVVAALREAHPYEEPSFSLLEHAPTPASGPGGAPVGLGRVGELPEPLTLAAFADLVASVLPHTAPGVLAGGDLDARVTTVALCSGAGDSLLGDARSAGADVYLTSDLRHHPASEHLEEGPPWLVGATHFATEAVALDSMADVLRRAVADAGHELDVRVSRHVTDPWTYRVPDAPATTADPADPAPTDPAEPTRGDLP